MKKTDKLKETGQTEIWIWEAYFHLSFLSFTLLCCSFHLARRNRKRHAFSFSLCLIMVLFRSALLCGASPEPRTSIAGQPVDYPDSRQNSNRTTNHSDTHPCQVHKKCFNTCSQEPCGDWTYSCFIANIIRNNAARSINWGHGCQWTGLNRLQCRHNQCVVLPLLSAPLL